MNIYSWWPCYIFFLRNSMWWSCKLVVMLNLAAGLVEHPLWMLWSDILESSHVACPYSFCLSKQ
jgi:hypothetical protein